MGVGIKCKLYRDSGTTTETWDEVNIVGDVDYNADPETVAVKTRESLVERSLVVGYKISASGMVRVVAGNADYAAMQSSSVGGVPLNYLILNADKTVVGASGFKGKMLISKWGESQKLGEIVMKAFELTPYMDDDPAKTPKFAEVTGTAGAGVLTYTDFGSGV